MKCKITFKAVLCFVLAMIVVTASVTPITVNAKTLKAPKLGAWKNVTPKDIEGDGVRYQITWKPVKRKDVAYEVKFYEREIPNEKWYTYTDTVYDCKASLDFSSVYQFKVKVRAVYSYETKKGVKTVYSKWSTSKTFTVNYY